jgi:membrane protein required for colicin V production
MPVTVLDAIVIVVVLISAILAMVRGFVREVLSVASWVAAAAAAYFFYKPIVPLVKPYIESNTVATIVAAAAIFFVALIVASYITMRISDFVIDSRVGAFDRMLGFVFGAARGVLLLVIAVLDGIGAQLMAALPEDAEATILRHLRGGDDSPGEAPPPPDGTDLPPAEEGAVPGDSSYGTGTRGGLDSLIENADAVPQ